MQTTVLPSGQTVFVSLKQERSQLSVPGSPLPAQSSEQLESVRHATLQGGFVQRNAQWLPLHEQDSLPFGLWAQSAVQSEPSWQFALQLAPLQVNAQVAALQKHSVHSASHLLAWVHEVEHSPPGQV